MLESECGLTADSSIADLGSGTGFLTELFLKHGNPCFGVEPNPEMRAAGEKVLARHPKFRSVDGTAESTGLPDHSVDLVSAGQAFHWFNREHARPEFVRILKPNGWLVLIWNGYRIETSPFLAGYQELVVRYGTDYSEVQREVVACDVESFYAPGKCRLANFDYHQTFDHQGLQGRLLSASYAPEPEHPDFQAMLMDVRKLFDAHQNDGRVVFAYETEVYYGQLPARK